MADPFSAVTLRDLGRPEDTFRLRRARYGPGLVESLQAIHETDAVVERVLGRVASGFQRRPRDLRMLDEARLLSPDWLQRPEMIGYAVDVDRFAGTIAGVIDHLDYLAWMGITVLDAGSILGTAGDRPGLAAGWDVRPEVGSVADLARLAGELRARGISLAIDLPVSAVSEDHGWVRRARDADPAFRSFFFLYPDRVEPDAWDRTAVPARADGHGNFTWDEPTGAWVWTSSAALWDLNWANPDVFCEFLDVVLELANLGVEVFRLRGLDRAWKAMGTTCVGQPEVHHLARALRAAVRIAAPAVAFVAEPVTDVANAVQYFGTRALHGQVSDMVPHESLAAQVWSGLASRDVRLSEIALAAEPQKPGASTWLTFVRSRDPLQWTISDDHARRASIDGHAHRSFLAAFYSGDFPGSFARGVVPQFPSDPRSPGVAGTCASLAGLEVALEERDPFGVDDAIRRILLLHTVALGFGGLPFLSMGDEIGIRNDPAAGGDAPHRPPMDWETAARAAAAWESGEVAYLPDADDAVGAAQWRDAAAARLYADFQHLIAVRASTPHLHAAVESRVVPSPDSRLLILKRDHPMGAMVQVYNFSESTVELSCDLLRGHLGVVADERLTGYEYSLMPWTLSIDPYRALWFTQKT